MSPDTKPLTYHYAKALYLIGLLENTLDDPRQKNLLASLRSHIEALSGDPVGPFPSFHFLHHYFDSV